MPEHISLLHYLLFRLDFLRTDSRITHSFFFHEHLGYRNYEPVLMAFVLMAVLAYLAWEVKSSIKNLKDAAVPEDELTLRTFFEVFVEYFYSMSVDVMGEKNSKRYFPLIGASAIFIFFSNVMGLIPGMLPPTSNLNVTAGCAILVFFAFNYFGIKENGLGYFAHMAGWGIFKNPIASLALALILFPVEVISLIVRPITLAIRLMLNMAVDHLL